MYMVHDTDSTTDSTELIRLPGLELVLNFQPGSGRSLVENVQTK